MRLALAIWLVACGVADAAPAAPAPVTAAKGPALTHRRAVRFTTEVLLTAVDDAAQRPKLDDAFAAVLAEFDRLDALLSEWRPDTPISRLNAAKGAPVPLPDEVLELLDVAQAMSSATEGGFDPTVATLADLWRFTPDAPRPTAAAITARLPAVGHRLLQVDERAGTARLGHPQTRLGLGGIAKGYAVRQAVAILRAHGVDRFCLKVGGELFCAGEKAPGRPWVVGVQDPRAPEKLVVGLAVRDAAFTTSGDYERFVVHDGVRDHHIINPRTGWPARGVRSVTILARDPVEADALSTGVFVMGVTAGLALVERMRGAEAVIIDDAGALHPSSGLKGALIPMGGESR